MAGASITAVQDMVAGWEQAAVVRADGRVSIAAKLPVQLRRVVRRVFVRQENGHCADRPRTRFG